MNDAGHMSETHFPEGVGAMGAVIQDQSFFGIDSIEEIGAKAHRDSDYTDQAAARRIAGDMVGLQRHRSQPA